MKRSEINKALKELEAMCETYKCYLPPFCQFTPEEWQTKGHEYDEIRDCMLGWDITDFGLGRFDEFGFSLITIRNGCRTQPEKYPKVYAEKLLYLKEGQMAANHFHWYKTEDIINRGGGNCLIRVYNRLPNEEIDYENTYLHPNVLTGSACLCPPVRRSGSVRVKASGSRRGCTTILPSRQERAPCCSARSASATTTTRITASILPWAVSRRSKKTSRRTACCATSILPQNNTAACHACLMPEYVITDPNPPARPGRGIFL